MTDGKIISLTDARQRLRPVDAEQGDPRVGDLFYTVEVYGWYDPKDGGEDTASCAVPYELDRDAYSDQQWHARIASDLISIAFSRLVLAGESGDERGECVGILALFDTGAVTSFCDEALVAEPEWASRQVLNALRACKEEDDG